MKIENTLAVAGEVKVVNKWLPEKVKLSLTMHEQQLVLKVCEQLRTHGVLAGVELECEMVLEMEWKNYMKLHMKEAPKLSMAGTQGLALFRTLMAVDLSRWPEYDVERNNICNRLHQQLGRL